MRPNGIENYGLKVRIISVMSAVTMLTFGTLVEAYKLLF